jgi:hypothetical protein
MFRIISGTSKTVSGTQNLERNVPNTAHKTVPDNNLLLGIVPIGIPCMCKVNDLLPEQTGETDT